MRKAIRLLHHNVYEYVDAATPRVRLFGIDLLHVEVDNVDEALAFREHAQVAMFRSLLAGGAVGVYAVNNGRVVGHAWASRGDRTRIANGYFRLGVGESLIHYCNVDPDYRGRGIYPAMIEDLVRTLRDRGDRRILVDTSVNNLASIRGIEKAGFVFLTDAWFVKTRRQVLLRWQRTKR